ncbi:hypothetical protein OUZ56_002458 [Daphnia magna]|uniref:Secreted protein n=1 Tax=Daphnia magna TaxID=35525 RepID=A0ABR0A5R9_9CRUS|nr:hypothetical protein OUZ56_002458 [Daphnia magna]
MTVRRNVLVLIRRTSSTCALCFSSPLGIDLKGRIENLQQSMVWFNHTGARTYSSLVFDVTRGQLIVAASVCV